MSTYTMSTEKQQIAQNLAATGIPQAQASAIAAEIIESAERQHRMLTDTPCSNVELNAVESRLTAKIDAVEARSIEKINSGMTHLTEEIRSAETRLTEQICAVETRLNEQNPAVDTRFAKEIHAVETPIDSRGFRPCRKDSDQSQAF